MIDREQLPEWLIERAKETMLRRVNQASQALGNGDAITYESLENECRPNDCSDCVLGHHLNVFTTTMEIRVVDEEQAEKIAAAWGTKYGLSPSGEQYEVVLPQDLQVATAAFDAGQIPELAGFESVEAIVTDRWDSVTQRASLGDAVTAIQLASALDSEQVAS